MKTHMQVFSILPDLTLFDVVPLRVAEACFEIHLDTFEGSIRPRVELSFDFVESNGSFDLLVVVWILSPRWEAHEIMGEDPTPTEAVVNIL